MLARVVYLKEGVASIQLKHDAANTPQITRVAPTQLWGRKEKRERITVNLSGIFGRLTIKVTQP